MADVGSLLKVCALDGGKVNLNYHFIPIAILDCTPTAMTYSTKLKTKNKKQVTTLLTGCQAAIYKDLNQIGSKTQRSELWVLEN